MSQETIAQLAARLEADTELRSAVAQATDPAQAAQILSAAGFAITAADVELAQPGALEDADLDRVTGGLVNPDVIGSTFAYAWTVCV